MNLYATYQKQVKKLELTERELLERREAIVSGIDHEQKAAKLSVLNRRIEEAIADGKPEAAQAEKEKLAAIGEESEKIENEIRRCVDAAADKGGFILASGCEVPPNASKELVQHFCDYAHTYGRYDRTGGDS